MSLKVSMINPKVTDKNGLKYLVGLTHVLEIYVTM